MLTRVGKRGIERLGPPLLRAVAGLAPAARSAGIVAPSQAATTPRAEAASKKKQISETKVLRPAAIKLNRLIADRKTVKTASQRRSFPETCNKRSSRVVLVRLTSRGKSQRISQVPSKYPAST